MKISPSLRTKLLTALIAAGVSIPGAYIATELTVPSEGMVLTPYKDPAGYTTICAGHLVEKGEVVKPKYTEVECVDIFVKDWKEHEKLLDSVVKVPYASPWMKGALTDFTFNKGIGNVASSTLLKKLNAKDYQGACEQLSRWVYAGGKVLPGLVIRATKQYSYCIGKEPADYKQTMQKYLPQA